MTYIFLAICSTLLIIGLFGKTKSNTRPIYKAQNIKEIVTSIDYGRVHPFHTGMNLEQVKNIVKKSCHETTEFENILHLQELMGSVRGVAIPLTSHALVNDVYLHLNKHRVVSSISIGISNLDFVTLLEQTLLKFGDPISFDRQFMTWKDTCMSITLDSINKRINVMDERLPNLCL